MKTDKLLFGAVCLGMGIFLQSAYNKINSDGVANQNQNTTLLGDTFTYKKALNQDTLYLSNSVKNDTLKLMKKVK